MTDQRTQTRVDAYLEEVALFLRDRPAGVRDSIIADLRAHIAEGLAESRSMDSTLEELGDPMVIAASVLDRDGDDPSTPPRPRRFLDSRDAVVATILALTLGALGLCLASPWLGPWATADPLLFWPWPGLLWLIGVVLLWASHRWPLWMKLFATLTIPVSCILLGSLRVVRWVSTSQCDSDTGCRYLAPGFMIVLGWFLLAVCLVASALSIVELGLRAGRAGRASRVRG